jgi:hypothetical protein
MRNTTYIANSLHLGVPIFKTKGGGSCMSGGSSWQTMACCFKTKREAINYIDYMDATQPKTTEGQRIKWQMIIAGNPTEK